MDSDLTNAPGDIPKFIKKMEEGYEVIKIAIRSVPKRTPSLS